MPFERQAARTAITSAVFALASLALAVFFGVDFAVITPQHEGYFLVAVDDAVRAPIPRRPRHTVMVLVDGLRRDAAETMASVRRIAEHGQCRVSDQGTYTISRPMYALLSTGVEVDRVGARNNDTTTPIGAQSVWESARRSGLVVGGSAHLGWFPELFPKGFDHYQVLPELDRDVFQLRELHDVDLFTPDYVDESQHHHGAHSPETALAVARVDREIGALLDRLDFDLDTVLVTADHGHLEHGGHGGPQPEVRYVLACVGGHNVRRLDGRPAMDGRVTAPLLAYLLGVPFPKHMAAIDDGLDAVFDIGDFGASPKSEAYVADRRAAVARFRDANRAELARWTGAPEGHADGARWTTFAGQEHARRERRLLVVAAVVVLLSALRLRLVRRHGPRRWVASAVWPALALGWVWAIHHALLGDLDFSALNGTSRYVMRATATVALAATASTLVHVALVRNLTRFVFDVTTLLALLLVLEAGHLLAYGWPLAFPLPSPSVRYLPFFGAFVQCAFAITSLVASVALLVRERGARRARAGVGASRPS
ncbi:MAG: alkaline phosphatase family protein [Deltaproteobacteria bacterium]|nr:alkaline phosphatase family protein [Deltaproteobacteria bacterium]